MGVSFSSCKKDHSILGADVQPEDDILGTSFSDTSSLFLHTIKHKAIFTSPSDNIKFLGSNQDPHFGRTDVGLYTNFCINNALTNVSFGDDANLVSSEIVLMVPSLDFIGNYSVSLNYSVYQMTTALTTSTLFYSSNDSLHSKSNLLGSYTGSFTVVDGKLALKIPIDNNFAKAVLQNPQYLVNNETLQNTYKGFYITAEGSPLNPVTMQGVITKIDLGNAISGFYLYYQNGTPSATKETKSYRFSFSGSGSVKHNTVKYNSAGGSYLLSDQLSGDTLKGKQNLFLKGLGGTKVKFYMPFLKSYADSFKVAVNRAEVVFNVDPSFLSPQGQYYPPSELALLAIDSLGRENFVVDQLSQVDQARYGGEYDDVNNRYVFNIARHVQSILNGTKKNLGFYLVVADPSPGSTGRRDNYAERVILAGMNNTSLKPKLNLSFIKFRNDK
ncbi:MAG: hypothetical protein K0S12_542 [Bacteroidetes bacterium]|nr:hypothetical protein [Bacteroidota bacterium]